MRKTLILIVTLFTVFSAVDAKSKKDQDRTLIDKDAMWQHFVGWRSGQIIHKTPAIMTF